MSAVKKKSETCGEQLRRMCKDIAEEITEGKTQEYIREPEIELTAEKFMDHVYDIRYIVDSQKRYLGAELMVAGGGPNIWVNLQTNTVDGYWASDKCSWGFVDNIGLDDYCEEMYG